MLGCVVVLALIVGVITIVANNARQHSDSTAGATTTGTSDWSFTTAPYTTVSTTPPFDWNSLDDAASDTTPATTTALLPQRFTDAKGVPYSRSAGGQSACVQAADSRNVSQALSQNGCVTEVTGSYIDDSQKILVSVRVMIFPTTTAAQAAYDALNGPTQDWGIWCPTTGVGSSTCDSPMRNATHSQWSTVSHRYFTEATGVYINLGTDNSLEDWTSAAAHEAIQQSGPAVYWKK